MTKSDNTQEGAPFFEQPQQVAQNTTPQHQNVPEYNLDPQQAAMLAEMQAQQAQHPHPGAQAPQPPFQGGATQVPEGVMSPDQYAPQAVQPHYPPQQQAQPPMPGHQQPDPRYVQQQVPPQPQMTPQQMANYNPPQGDQPVTHEASYGQPPQDPAMPAQPPQDDYYYPQGQSILPDVPAVATPLAMPGAEMNAQNMPAYGAGEGAAPPNQMSEMGQGYEEPYIRDGAGEQISQRLAQLQSDYDAEVATHSFDAQGYGAPSMDPNIDYQQQTYSDPNMVAQNNPVPPQTTQAPQYAPNYGAVPENTHEVYPAADAFAQAHQQGLNNGYGQDESQHYAQNPDIAHQEPTGGGFMKKALLGGVFATAIIVGGGAAYTFKNSDMFSDTSTGSSTPTIKAAGLPTKILKTPTGANKDSLNKQMHNRLAGSKPGGKSPLGTLDIAPKRTDIGAATKAVKAAASGMLPAKPKVGNAGAPRRVKTLIVRPDGTILRPSGGSGAVAASGPTATSVAPGINAASIAKIKPVMMKNDVKPKGVRRMKTISEASNAKHIGGVVKAPSGKTVKRASLTVPKTSKPVRAAAPKQQPRAAARPAPTQGEVGEPYVVQVTSRSSQTSALAAFADMQQKYPSLIGSFAPDIQRADLGNKGVWYRLRVGPVVSKTAASDLCSRLKAAGHPGCFIRRK